MKGSIIRWLCLIAVAGMLFSCSETKSLQEGQYLYDGAKIKIEAKPRIKKKERNALKEELEDLVEADCEEEQKNQASQAAERFRRAASL